MNRLTQLMDEYQFSSSWLLHFNLFAAYSHLWSLSNIIRSSMSIFLVLSMLLKLYQVRHIVFYPFQFKIVHVFLLATKSQQRQEVNSKILLPLYLLCWIGNSIIIHHHILLFNVALVASTRQNSMNLIDASRYSHPTIPIESVFLPWLLDYGSIINTRGEQEQGTTTTHPSLRLAPKVATRH